MDVMLMKIRTEEERKKFFKEQDGWTEFQFETVELFGRNILMSKCVKCGEVRSLAELFTYLSPLHCVGCGRTTLEQDRVKYKDILDKHWKKINGKIDDL
jgi:hypothetical protein